MVATDRLSAFDVVLPDPIPGKGEMLCQISNFWFDKTEHIDAQPPDRHRRGRGAAGRRRRERCMQSARW